MPTYPALSGTNLGTNDVPVPDFVDMQCVVDSNFLQDPLLRDYLSASKWNVAILTDYVMMEAYKGDALKSVFKSMATVADFPDQVIVLKGTKQICGLSGRTSGLTRRLICSKSTHDFEKFSEHIRAVIAGQATPSRSLVEHGRVASEHMKKNLGRFGAHDRELH